VSAEPITVADLRRVDLFDDLGESQLAEWLAVAWPRDVAAGEIIVEQEDATSGVMLLLEGVIQTSIVDGPRSDPVRNHRAPTWLGAISALTGTPLGVRAQALEPCHLGLIPSFDFHRLALAQPPVHDRVMRQVAPVIGRLNSIGQNRERLTSLGTMAAGLAHELNNPAAAIGRASAQLVEVLDVVNATLATFVESGVERAEAEQLVALQREAIACAASRTALDALDAADAEDELRDRLERLGVAEAWRLAEPLATAGVDDAWLARLAELAGPATDAALRWVAATLGARALAAELQESARRMASLVGAVKSYAYMDRGELVEVDLHEGLETTLVVLGHKLKHSGVTVSRDYDRSLPKVTVRGSELNQVWTNLLDNAIDAAGAGGAVAVATRRDGGCAVVDVIDDGPGIPDEIRERIFDQFFTTKDVGQGTGLGLATARRIVVDRHDGSLSFDSEPGRTAFHVRLPLRHA
jgi:signal transduction histidine kinase